MLRNAFGGEFVNDYRVPGNQSSQGLTVRDDLRNTVLPKVPATTYVVGTTAQ